MSSNVLITGTSSGLGKALAREFYYRGYNIYSLGKSIPSRDVYCRHVGCDLANLHTIRDCIKTLVIGCSGFDYVFLNAGVLGRLADSTSLCISEMLTSINVNALSNKVMIDYMLDRGLLNNVISISSGAALKSYYGWAAYCGSKALMKQMIDCYAIENPHVNFLSLAPGVIKTKMQDYIKKQNPNEIPSVAKFQEMYDSMQTPEQIALKIVRNIDNILEDEHDGHYFDLRTIKDEE